MAALSNCRKFQKQRPTRCLHHLLYCLFCLLAGLGCMDCAGSLLQALAHVVNLPPGAGAALAALLEEQRCLGNCLGCQISQLLPITPCRTDTDDWGLLALPQTGCGCRFLLHTSCGLGKAAATSPRMDSEWHSIWRVRSGSSVCR